MDEVWPNSTHSLWIRESAAWFNMETSENEKTGKAALQTRNIILPRRHNMKHNWSGEGQRCASARHHCKRKVIVSFARLWRTSTFFSLVLLADRQYLVINRNKWCVNIFKNTALPAWQVQSLCSLKEENDEVLTNKTLQSEDQRD